MIELPTKDKPYSLVCGDCIEEMKTLPDDSVDLLMCSPPYELARTYSIDFDLQDQAWVDWMVTVVRTAAPKVKGLIAIVCEGQTRKFCYSCVPFLLMADLHRAGFNLRKPPAYQRIGIPGSGGPDWLRNDYEPIVCITRHGKLAWSDNKACGHPPKWAPGGEMSHRTTAGLRANAKSHYLSISSRGKNGRKESGGRRVTSGHVDGDTPNDDTYLPPAIANPGNNIQPTYTNDEVRELLERCGVTDETAPDVVKCKVGGGLMGHAAAHENEAPFPLALAEFFVKSFCPKSVCVACGTAVQYSHENKIMPVVQKTIPDNGLESSVLLNQVPQAGIPDRGNCESVRSLQQGLPDVGLQDGEKQILQQGMCESGDAKGEGELQGMQASDQTSEGHDRSTILFKNVRQPMDGKEPCDDQIPDQDNARIHTSSPSTASTGGQEWIRNGASGADGKTNRPSARKRRSGSPQEREKGRQPDNQLGIDDKKSTRQASKDTPASDLPELRTHRAKEDQASQCPSCGANLTLPGAIQPGLVLDCFSGSATTGHAALANGRRYIGIDVRQSQIDLGIRRLESGITPGLFT